MKDEEDLQYTELEREKAKKTGGAPQVMKDEEDLQYTELEREKAKKTGCSPGNEG